MNKKKWKIEAERNNLSLAEWLAKLAEEFGEVAHEVTDLSEYGDHARMQKTRDALYEELGHVEFIAKCMRRAVLRTRLALSDDREAA